MEHLNLHTTKMKSGFKAPDPYFDGFEDRVLNRLEQNSQKPVKKLWASKYWPYNSVAACILVVFGIFFYMNQSQAKIDQKYLESYLISNTTSDEIYKNFTDKDIQELTETILNSQEIKEYVLVDLDYYPYAENE